MSLDNPTDADAPLVALIKRSPSEMSNSELSETLAELRALRTTSSTVKKKINNNKSKPAAPKCSFNLDDLLK